MTKALLTGASSFTGSWIASALAERGAQVIAPLRGSAEHGKSLRARRLQRAGEAATIVAETPLASERLLALVRESGPFDLACFHAAEVSEFRSPDFDAYRAFARNMEGMTALLDLLTQQGCRRMVITGSLFEADEGLGDLPRSAIGAYGLAKTLTWQAMRHEGEKRGFRHRQGHHTQPISVPMRNRVSSPI